MADNGTTPSLFTDLASTLFGTDTGGAGTPTPAVVGLTFESNITPSIPLAGGPGSIGNLIQPAIRGAFGPLGAVDVAPFGRPNAIMGTIVFLSVIGLAVFGLIKLVR